MRKPPLQTVRMGTRGSALARWQTGHVRDLLLQAWPGLDVQIEVITTHGDRALETPLPLIGGKGVFTAELEAALREGAIDLAVHSLKDLPTDPTPGLVIGAIPPRATPDDALISRSGAPLDALPQSATIGTSSRRRMAQLLHLRPDLHIMDLRGNVDTRLRKALEPDGPYDAIMLACAGLERLGRQDAITERIALEAMLPAPGQGALAIQCRDGAASLALLAPLNDSATLLAVTAERAFLAALGGGCSVPVASYASVEGATLTIRGRVTAPDGAQQVDVALVGETTGDAALRLGQRLADEALAQGAVRLLEVGA